MACSRPRLLSTLDAGPERMSATAGSASATAPTGLLDVALDAAVEPQSATVKLLDPGRAPRRRLRHKWKIQQKERLTMDLRTALSNELGGTEKTDIALPPVHVVVDIDPQTVAPDGGLLTYAWRVTAASTADVQTPPQVALGMRAEVDAVEHLTGTGQVDSFGVSEDVSAAPVAISDAGATGQMVEQIKQTLRDLAAPFPAEEVGIGARWRRLSRLAAEDARITQADTFSLVELSGNVGRLDDVLAQTAPPQVLRAPGVPEGSQARMESMLASGNATIRFDLTRFVPQTQFDGTTTMVLSGAAPQEAPRHVTMVLRVEIRLAGSIR